MSLNRFIPWKLYHIIASFRGLACTQFITSNVKGINCSCFFVISVLIVMNSIHATFTNGSHLLKWLFLLEAVQNYFFQSYTLNKSYSCSWNLLLKWLNCVIDEVRIFIVRKWQIWRLDVNAWGTMLLVGSLLSYFSKFFPSFFTLRLIYN